MPQIIDDKLLMKRLFQDIQRHQPRKFDAPHYVEEGENAVRRLIPKFTKFDALTVALNGITEREYKSNVANNGVDTLIIAYKALQHFGNKSSALKNTIFLALEPIIEQLKTRLRPKYEEEILAAQNERDAILADAKKSFAAHGAVYYIKADNLVGDYPYLDKAGMPWLFTEEGYAAEAKLKADCAACSVASFPVADLNKKLAEFVGLGVKNIRLNPHTSDNNISFNCRELLEGVTVPYAAELSRSVLSCLCLGQGRSSDHLINYGGDVMHNLKVAASKTLLLVPFDSKGTLPTDKLYYSALADINPNASSAAALGVPGGEKLGVAASPLSRDKYNFFITEERSYCYIAAFTDMDSVVKEYGDDVNVGLFTFGEVFDFVTLEKKVKGADGVAIFCGENRLLLSATESATVSKIVTVNAYQDYCEVEKRYRHAELSWTEAYPPQRLVPAVSVGDGFVTFFTQFVNFKGRANKQESIAGAAIWYAAIALTVMLGLMAGSTSAIIGAVVIAILSVGFLSCNVRRMHDMGYTKGSSWGRGIMCLVPLLNVFFLFRAGEDMDNEYGPRRDVQRWEAKEEK